MNYELYPLLSSDINYPIYYMVRYFFSAKHRLYLPPCELEEEFKKVNNGKGIGLSLTFPSEDYSVSYDYYTLQKEVILLKDCTIKHKDDSDVPYEAYLFGDEEKYIKTSYEPHEEHYYIDINPDTNNYWVVKEKDTFEWCIPEFFDNTVQFRRALEKICGLLMDMETDGGNWTSRLKTTIKMLDNRVNELHILHNAGLYDFHILERNLVNYCLDESRWRFAFNDYVSQLKVFAMYALNNLGWSMHGSGFGDDPESLGVIEMLEPERNRRKTMSF